MGVRVAKRIDGKEGKRSTADEECVRMAGKFGVRIPG